LKTETLIRFYESLQALFKLGIIPRLKIAGKEYSSAIGTGDLGERFQQILEITFDLKYTLI